jgi:uncharacterized protein
VVTRAATPPPYVVAATVTHRRHRPVDYRFEHRTTAWLVDAAAPQAAIPRWLRGVLSIRGTDHLAAGDAPLLEKVRTTISQHDLDWSAARVQVLTNARTMGHVFDPLTTYFCFAADGRLEGILAEVHNTYGGRHTYPLKATGAPTQPMAVRAVVEKTFYVSPFFTVEGRYDITARLTESAVAVSISLTQDGERVFTGAVHGRLTPATRAAVVRAWLRDPLASQRVSGLIRWHGIRLWLRRLPVVPRGTAPTPETHVPTNRGVA